MKVVRLLFFIAGSAGGMQIDGVLPPNDGKTELLHYVGKFCFDQQRASALLPISQSPHSPVTHGGPPPCTDCVQLKNLRSGKCLWVDFDGNSQQRTCPVANYFRYSLSDGTLRDVATDLCLDVKQASTSNLGRYTLFQCTGALNQRFDHSESSAVSARHSGMCIDVDPSWLDEDGAATFQATCAAGSSSQQWLFAKPVVPTTSTTKATAHCTGCVQIRNMESHKCLRFNEDGVSDQYGCTFAGSFQFDQRTGMILDPLSAKCVQVIANSWDSGARLGLADCPDSPPKNFQFDYQANSTKEIRARGSGLCLDVAMSASYDGADVIQYACTGNTNQQWVVTPTASKMDDKCWKLQNVESGKCLSVEGKGTPSHQWACEDATQFEFDRVVGSLKDVATGKCLDVIGASLYNKVRLTLWDCDENPPNNRRFSYTEGSKQLTSWSSGKCVGTHAGSRQNGNAITQDDCAGGLNQQWELVRCSRLPAYIEQEKQNEISGWVSFEVNGYIASIGRLLAQTAGPGPNNSTGLFLAMFDDTVHGEWPKIRAQWKNTELNCHQFLKLARYVRPLSSGSDSLIANIKMEQFLRPRFLYFALVLCDARSASPIKYRLITRNMHSGTQAEFSKEEMGLLLSQQVSFVCFGLLVVATCANATLKYGPDAMRGRYPLQFVFCSCILSTVGSLCLMSHYMSYAQDGVGKGGLEVAGQVLSCFARVMLSLLQLFMVRGKALLLSTDEGHTHVKQVYLRGLVVAVVVLDVGCEFYGRYFGGTDWSTTVYFYESWPGLIVLLLNAVLFYEVVSATQVVLRRFDAESKIAQYYKWSFFAAVGYFASMPLICLLALSIEPWNRKWVVNRAELAVRFVATLVLSFWFRPQRLDHKIAANMELPADRKRALELTGPLTGHLISQ